MPDIKNAAFPGSQTNVSGKGCVAIPTQEKEINADAKFVKVSVRCPTERAAAYFIELVRTTFVISSRCNE
jgi:hypothetical protein